MITESEVTDFFCIADDFCKEFDAEVAKKLFNQCFVSVIYWTLKLTKLSPISISILTGTSKLSDF